MKSEEKIRAEIRRVDEILKDKAMRDDKSDWDYWTFYRDGLKWALGEEE